MDNKLKSNPLILINKLRNFNIAHINKFIINAILKYSS